MTIVSNVMIQHGHKPQCLVNARATRGMEELSALSQNRLVRFLFVSYFLFVPVGDCLLVVSGERSLGVLSRGQHDSWLPEMAALHLLTGLVTDMWLVHASSP